MPRVRTVSPTGYYHVTSRGVGQMIIFENDGDRRRYLQLLKRYRDKYSLRIIAWVLMDNHVHLLLDAPEDMQLSYFMHDLNTAYAFYFRQRTEHVGHVFQARFWCGAIVTDQQLIATVDYIHRNPVRARVGTREGYRWSSYQEYLGKHWVVDTAIVLGLLGGVERFKSYCLDSGSVVAKPRENGFQSDEDVLNAALRCASVTSSGELRGLPREEKAQAMRALRNQGATLKQIARVFGVSISTVSRFAR